MRMREPSSVESTNYSHTQTEIQTMLEVSSSGDNVHSAPPFFPLSPQSHLAIAKSTKLYMNQLF